MSLSVARAARVCGARPGYHRRMEDAANLVLVGPMGAGKSVAGARLATRLGRRVVDLDAVIQAEAGCSVAALFAAEGEAGFRSRESALLARCLSGEPCVIATGGGAVLSAENRRRMAEQAFVVWLGAEPATQLERVAGSEERPLLHAADPAAVLHRLAAERTPLYEALADLRLHTDGLSTDQVVDALEALIRDRWPRAGVAA